MGRDSASDLAIIFAIDWSVNSRPRILVIEQWAATYGWTRNGAPCSIRESACCEPVRGACEGARTMARREWILTAAS